jgi:hypothetical protein
MIVGIYPPYSVFGFLRRLLDLHLEFVDELELERELS